MNQEKFVCNTYPWSGANPKSDDENNLPLRKVVLEANSWKQKVSLGESTKRLLLLIDPEHLGDQQFEGKKIMLKDCADNSCITRLTNFSE